MSELAVIDQVRRDVEAMRPQFLAALPKQMPTDRFIRVAMTAIQMQPMLLTADRKTLFSSLMKCAQDGLIPDNREATLVQYNSKNGPVVQYQPMIGGILKKIRNSGELLSIGAHLVHELDAFDFSLGDDERITHKPYLDGDPGKVRMVYAIAKTKDGGIYREVMSVSEVEKVRAVSKAKDSGPWVAWWGEMAKKTVLKRMSKRMPMSTDVEDMLDNDDAEDTSHANGIAHQARPITEAVVTASVKAEPIPTVQVGAEAAKAAIKRKAKAPDAQAEAKTESAPQAADEKTATTKKTVGFVREGLTGDFKKVEKEVVVEAKVAEEAKTEAAPAQEAKPAAETKAPPVAVEKEPPPASEDECDVITVAKVMKITPKAPGPNGEKIVEFYRVGSDSAALFYTLDYTLAAAIRGYEGKGEKIDVFNYAGSIMGKPVQLIRAWQPHVEEKEAGGEQFAEDEGQEGALE